MVPRMLELSLTLKSVFQDGKRGIPDKLFPLALPVVLVPVHDCLWAELLLPWFVLGVIRRVLLFPETVPCSGGDSTLGILGFKTGFSDTGPAR